MRQRFFWLGWVLVICLLATPGYAYGIRMKTNFGFGNRIVPERWMPLSVHLSDPVEDGTIKIIHQDLGSPISICEKYSLQNATHLECPIYVGTDFDKLQVQLWMGDQMLDETVLEITGRTFPGHVILTAGMPASVQTDIEQILLPREPVLVVATDVSQLPQNALNYDGVSGLVVRDPGPVLAPLQTQALISWLAGGGKLVLYGIRPVPGSLFSQIAPREPVTSRPYQFGLGTITVVSQDWLVTSGNKRREWQRLFELLPYAESFRISPGAVFPTQSDYKTTWNQDYKLAPLYTLFIILIIWAGLGILSGNILKKWCVPVLIGYSLLTAVAIMPLGFWLTSEWQRGAGAQIEALLLPDARTAWLAGDIQLARRPLYGSVEKQTSPWGVDIQYGDHDYGRIRTEDYGGTFWNHSFAHPSATLQEGGPESLRVISQFELGSDWKLIRIQVEKQRFTGISNQKLNIRDRILLWDGHQYWMPLTKESLLNSWRQTTNIPNWLLSESSWIENLKKIKPNQAWLVGNSELPQSQLLVQHNPISRGVWAMPLQKENAQ